MATSQHLHDRLLVWGFSLAYASAMVAGLCAEAEPVAAWRGLIWLFGCLPAFGIGVAILALAHALPVAAPPLARRTLTGQGASGGSRA